MFKRIYSFLFDLGGVCIDFLENTKFDVKLELFNVDYKNNCLILRIDKLW